MKVNSAATEKRNSISTNRNLIAPNKKFQKLHTLKLTSYTVVRQINWAVYRPRSAFKIWEIAYVLKMQNICCMFISGCELHIVCTKVVKNWGLGLVVAVVSRPLLTDKITYAAEWVKYSRMFSARHRHGDCTEEMWHHVWPWTNAEISTDDKYVHLVHQSTNVIRLHLVPAALTHIRLVYRVRVFHHYSFFTRVDSIIQCIDTLLSASAHNN